MPFLTCVNCGDVFETPDKIDKCPECVLHSSLFDDILNDVATEVSCAPVTWAHPVIHLTPEEAGLKATSTWRDDYEELLNVLNLKDVTNLRDFTLLITAMGWKRNRIHPWHAILIVTFLYNRDPKMCEVKEMLVDERCVAYHHFTSFHNPFRLLKSSHPGVAKYATKVDKSFADLVGEAEVVLQKDSN
jgi:hypothetical protein